MHGDSAAQPSKRRRGLGILLLGVTLMLLGPVLSLAGSLYGILHHVHDIHRFTFPGEKDLTLDAGTYTIYFELRSVVDNRSVVTLQVPPLECSLTAADGSEIPLVSSVGSHYQLGDYEGRSLYRFDIDTPGEYRLTATDGNSEGKEFVLAVQQGSFLQVFSAAFAWSCGGAIILLTGIVLGIIGIVRLTTSR